MNMMMNGMSQQLDLIKNKWAKISGLETNIFGLKMMVKSGLEFFILKFY